MNSKCLGLVVFVMLACAMKMKAGAVFFARGTDTIEISGQTVIGTSCTYEAVILFPVCTNADGSIFMEHQVFQEDKQFFGGPTFFRGFNFASACCLEFSTNIAFDVFHHVAFVYDGTEERYYIDGNLVTNRVVGSFDVADSDAPGHIGAFIRSDAGLQNSFIGLLDSVRLSAVARYSGNSFSPPTGDMTTDADTVLLYNFNDAPGSTNVVDESPLARTGTLGIGLAGATSPQLVIEGFDPCQTPTADCSLAPLLATNSVGELHTVTITVTSNGVATGDINVTFSLTGANGTVQTNIATDVNGQASFSYTGLNTGNDNILASGTIGASQFACNATKVWTTGTCSCPDLTGTWSNLVQTCKFKNDVAACKVKGQLLVRNIGCLDAPTTFIRYYLSDDDVFDEGDTFLKQVATGAIKLDKPKKRTLSAKLPAGVNGSGKFILAVLDADHTLTECNENNNTAASAPLPSVP